MNDKFAIAQKSKISKKDWKKQNFLNMVSLYQHELIQEGLDEIWGSRTGFSYSSGDGLEELLSFIPPVETNVVPIAPVEEESKATFDSLGNLNYSDISYPEYEYDAYSSSGSQGPLMSHEGSPKNSMYSGPHDISFLNKYARFLVPGSFVCTVQFKYACRDYSITEYLMSTQTIDIGSVLVVRSHVDIRQIDMGVVVRIFTVEEYKEYKSYIGRSTESDENFVGQVLRVAFKKDTKKLTLKHTTEATLLPICQNLVQVHQLPILVYGIEFQYDGFNLFVYYTRRTGPGTDVSEKLDFKAYIYDLIIDCPHTRIIMKDTTNCRPFAPDPMAEKKLKKL